MNLHGVNGVRYSERMTWRLRGRKRQLTARAMRYVIQRLDDLSYDSIIRSCSRYEREVREALRLWSWTDDELEEWAHAKSADPLTRASLRTGIRTRAERELLPTSWSRVGRWTLKRAVRTAVKAYNDYMDREFKV